MDGPQREQYAPPQRCCARRRGAADYQETRSPPSSASTGARPKGWLGSGLQETWNTLDLLAAEGCDYVCDWTNDDQPYVMTLEGGRQLVSLPYSHDINDKPAFERINRTPDDSAT